MSYKEIKRGMVLADDEGEFVIARKLGRGINKSDPAGWYVLFERLDLHEDLTFHPSGDMFFQPAHIAEMFYGYVGRWPDGNNTICSE